MLLFVSNKALKKYGAVTSFLADSIQAVTDACLFLPPVANILACQTSVCLLRRQFREISESFFKYKFSSNVICNNVCPKDEHSDMLTRSSAHSNETLLRRKDGEGLFVKCGQVN